MKKNSVFVSVFVFVFVFANGVFAQKTASKGASMAITATTKYQHIDGFGGTGMNGQWSDKYTQEKVNKLWGTGKDQMGLNIMRIRINPNEGNWGEYGNPIKWARKINPDVQVFATPWTPPKKWKTSKTEKYQNEFGTWVWPLVEHSWGGQGSNGGTFNDEYTEDYADFFERYRQTMEQKGCPIDIISIQNESDYTPTATDDGVEHASYESCIFSPKQMAAILKATREKVDKKCKVMGPECFGWGQHNYNNTLVNLPDATNSIDIWGNHIYGTNSWDYINSVTKKTGKPMWMTEFLITNETGNWSEEYGMIESIEKALSSGFSAYVYYNMLADFFGDGKSDNGETSSTLGKRAYVFGHYAKYATGKYRVKTNLNDANGGLVASAYATENNDTVTVFVLNKSENDYSFLITLPDTMQQVNMAVTNEAVNRYIADVSDKYAGKRRPTLKLQPESFYTFEFIKTAKGDDPSDPVVATSLKNATNNNPISVAQFCADPTSIEYNGRVYVYATNDQQQFDYTEGLSTNNYSKITSLVMMSSADMVNWTHHGTIDVKSIAPWINTSWAPSIVSREEADGKTHFYMYFTNTAAGIGVLTATSPTGPWTDPLGKALIDSKTAGLGTISNIIDPGAVIDSDGNGWLSFGGGSVNSEGTAADPGNARIVKLGSDMISLASDIVKIPAPYHFEANELNFIGGKWVFSYCTTWSAPNAAAIQYMISTDPLSGKWTTKTSPLIMKNPGSAGYPYGNNHTHLQKVGNNWYIFYHNQWMENQKGLSGGYRNLALNRATLVERSQTFGEVTMTDAGVAAITANRPNAFERQSAAMVNNCAGVAFSVSNTENSGECVTVPKAMGWTMVKNATFDGDKAKTLTVNIQGKGTLEMYFDAIGETPVAKIDFNNEEMAESTVNLNAADINGTHNVYFLFKGAQDVKWQDWQVVGATSGISGTSGKSGISGNSGTSGISGISGLSGLSGTAGIYIENGKKYINK